MASKKKNKNTSIPHTQVTMVASRSVARVDRHPDEKAYLSNFLSNFEKALTAGFSQETWEEAAKNYRWLSLQLFQGDREILGNVWRNAFVGDLSTLSADIEGIRQRL